MMQPGNPCPRARGSASRVHVIVSGNRDRRRLGTCDGIAIAAPHDCTRRLGMPEHP